jgi:hypothetical protein
MTWTINTAATCEHCGPEYRVSCQLLAHGPASLDVNDPPNLPDPRGSKSWRVTLVTSVGPASHFPSLPARYLGGMIPRLCPSCFLGMRDITIDLAKQLLLSVLCCTLRSAANNCDITPPPPACSPDNSNSRQIFERCQARHAPRLLIHERAGTGYSVHVYHEKCRAWEQMRLSRQRTDTQSVIFESSFLMVDFETEETLS